MFPNQSRRASVLHVAMATLLLAPLALHAQEAALAGSDSEFDRSSVSSSGSALPNAPSAADNERVSMLATPTRILLDQLHIFTFPRYTAKSDLKWLLPLTGAAVVAFSTDEYAMSQVVTTNPSTNANAQNVSDGLRDGLIAAPILLFGAGSLAHNDHAREAGLLGGEAMIDAAIVGQIVKVASFRERPNVDRSEGSFYRLSSGTDSSFVSGHALTAWSSAAVLASEYHNPWAQAGIYTLASGVSLTRVLGQEHFPSDVLLGSAAGWLIGHYVYKAHHRFHRPIEAGFEPLR